MARLGFLVVFFLLIPLSVVPTKADTNELLSLTPEDLPFGKVYPVSTGLATVEMEAELKSVQFTGSYFYLMICMESVEGMCLDFFEDSVTRHAKRIFSVDKLSLHVELGYDKEIDFVLEINVVIVEKTDFTIMLLNLIPFVLLIIAILLARKK